MVMMSVCHAVFDGENGIREKESHTLTDPPLLTDSPIITVCLLLPPPLHPPVFPFGPEADPQHVGRR